MKIISKKLDSLIEEIVSDRLVLPTFQREFVWERESQKRLIASFLNQLPLGSYLLSTGMNSLNYREMGLKSDYKSTPPNTGYILDGQQRITTLFNAFYNIYDQYPKYSPDDILEDLIFNKLKVRWFLDLSVNYNEEYNCFGLELFHFKNNMETLKIEERIVYKNDIKRGLSDGYGVKPDLENLTNFCVSRGSEKRYLLPLFLLNDKQMFRRKSGIDALKSIIKEIVRDRCSYLEMSAPEKELRKIANEHDLTYPTIGELREDFFENGKLEDISSDWLFEFYGFLKSRIQSEQFVIELNDWGKVIDSFNYLNKGGTPLSTFDLLCSKFYEINIKKILKEEIEIGESTIKKDGIEYCILYRDLLEDSKERNSAFNGLFTQVVSVFHYLKSNPSTNELRIDVLKSNYFFDKIKVDDLDKQDFELCARILLNTLSFVWLNFGFKGLEKLPNTLSTIPIVWYLVDKFRKGGNVNFDILADNSRICALYYYSIFTGKYDSHQNENCVIMANLIPELIEGNRSTIDDIKNKVKSAFEVGGFLDFQKLAMQDFDQIITQSVKLNILNFYLCKSAIGIADFDPNGNHIKYDTTDLQVHHILPLKQFRRFTDYTKDIRKNSNFRANSVLNLTIISGVVNRGIGGMSYNDYMQKLDSQLAYIEATHLLVDDYQNIDIDNLSYGYDPIDNDHKKLDKVFRSRFKKIQGEVVRQLVIWLN